MSSQQTSRPPRPEDVTQHTNSFSGGQPIFTNASDEIPGGDMPEEEETGAAELSRDESINFPEEQEEGQTSFTQEAGQSGPDAKQKRKPLSQEEIRRLDKYAQCPHCSVVNAIAGNLKVHWEYQNGHPDDKYRVEDVWIFEREKGSTGPHKRRKNGGKVKAGPTLSGARPTTRAMVRSGQVQISDLVKSEASYLDQSGHENSPQDDLGEDGHPTLQRPRYSMENEDLDFMQEESQSRGGPTRDPSGTTRRGNDRTMNDRRESRSRIPSQKVKTERDDEDDTSNYEMEAAIQASLQTQNLPHASTGANASTSTPYPTTDPGQQFAPHATRPADLITGASLFNPTPRNTYEPRYAYNPLTTFRNNQSPPAPFHGPSPQNTTHPSYPMPLPLSSMDNLSRDSTSGHPPDLSHSSQETHHPIPPPRNARPSAQSLSRTPSAAASVHGKKRKSADRSASPDEREVIANQAYGLGFDAGWKQALEHVRNVQRDREDGLASLGVGGGIKRVGRAGEVVRGEEEGRS